jgi:hypothetical protein
MPSPPAGKTPAPRDFADRAPDEPDHPVPPEPVRSLADELRGWTVEDLVALLRTRPDLVHPLPTTLTELATRATTRTSVRRVMDALDTRALQVLDVLSVLPEPATPDGVDRWWGACAAQVLTRLRGLGLIWGPREEIYTVRAVNELLGAHPAGLGPPLAQSLARRSPDRIIQLAEDLGLTSDGAPGTGPAPDRIVAHLSDPGTVLALVDGAPTGARQVLDRLVWGPPVGHVPDADRPVRRSGAAGPVEWLLAHGLLAVADSAHVVLPREVALALRGGHVHRTPAVEPPPLPVEHRPADVVRRTAAEAAAEAVRLVGAVAERLGRHPVPVLRTGGFGVRELRRLATDLDTPEPTAALALEIGHVAGLLADDGQVDPSWAPTPAFDEWSSREIPDQWVCLAEAWLETTRCPRLVGTRDRKGSTRQALAPGIDRAEAPDLRRRILLALDRAPTSPDRIACTTVRDLRNLMDWVLPRGISPARQELVTWIVEESAWIGATGAGGLAPAFHPLLAEEPDPVRAAESLAGTLPEPVDHILVQADLTAIVPGPCEPELARELDLIADVDSRGAATVYRFTPESVRRALDTGRTADDLLELLRRRAVGELPQPLRYLITDTARGVGRIRIGSLGCYLLSDDEPTLMAVLADRRATALGLRRLAPTVLAAQAAPETVVAALRGWGLAPVVEGPHGELVLEPPPRHRSRARSRPRPVSPLPSPPSAELLTGVVNALVHADRTVRDRTDPAHPDAATPPIDPRPAAPGQVLALLRDAVSRHEPVWIGYADPTGAPVPRLVQPLHVEAGRLDVRDRSSGTIRTLSVHRIASVTPAAE